MKVVLHICCGVCAAGAVTELAQEGHAILGYFYNPNIYPLEEYQRRLEAAIKVAKMLHFSLKKGLYTPEKWFEATEFMKAEPEGGNRCQICYRMRLQETFDYVEQCGADCFTSTLSISPHKSASTINEIGREIGGNKFLTKDFKKKEGFKRASQLARQWGLYRQNYCGCIYSKR
jgi:predicted adenine nucleotide alpha hydrolase (AANH) superfamily ATPase